MVRWFGLVVGDDGEGLWWVSNVATKSSLCGLVEDDDPNPGRTSQPSRCCWTLLRAMTLAGANVGTKPAEWSGGSVWLWAMTAKAFGGCQMSRPSRRCAVWLRMMTRIRGERRNQVGVAGLCCGR